MTPESPPGPKGTDQGRLWGLGKDGDATVRSGMVRRLVGESRSPTRLGE